MTKPINYAELVSYEDMDPFKVSATQAAASTAGNLQQHGYTEVGASRGESAYVWDEGDKYRAGVIEGLGTKNLATDEVDADNPDMPSKYKAIAQDSIAMIVNDLIVCGAIPQLFWVHLAAGESKWFTDARKTDAFNMGCAAVCNEIGVTWAGGESPTLPDIIVPGASEISGFMMGEINPKSHYVPGNTLEDGDAVILVESSGIHANGLTSARKLADRLSDGYQTVLPDGTTFGDALLQPTNLYSNMVRGLLERGVSLKRMENITGHGWRKLMRARESFTYRMHELPPAMPLFDFLQAQLQVDKTEMFGNYNMGAGFALYTPQSEVSQAIDTAAEHGYTAWHAGNVEAGPKQVIIEPLNVVFSAASLGVRS
ncbi:MAG: Phosphoribosylformylglycinamidine cyclo-ligase [Candidatus Saccharibacteria bacterium]|nr:Phosphoribosylformylglycinamidine cyclo-ligase [Candidatus Saccharibacteria bacterium]